MNKERICTVRGIFTGIYQWGEGYEFFGTRDEVLDELREHMDLMRSK